jgi:transcriptional regulator with XRE-family HTH domain
MSDRENIQEVAARLRGLREALELTTAQVAEKCGIDEDTYKEYESGNADIPISFIQNLADNYGVQVPELLFGMSPKMSSYYVTRSGERLKRGTQQGLFLSVTCRRFLQSTDASVPRHH